MTQRARPNPWQWITYSWGRKLPDELQDWVRHDLTGRWRVPRHLLRGMIPFFPVFAVFLLFPGPIYLRLAMILLGLILALFYCGAYMQPNREHRLELHGLPADLESPERVRKHDANRAAYEKIHGRSVPVPRRRQVR
ncbi:UNVERIFIED_CONTAM: hypothetical protein DES50_10936 [Williamsia faeni]